METAQLVAEAAQAAGTAATGTGTVLAGSAGVILASAFLVLRHLAAKGRLFMDAFERTAALADKVLTLLDRRDRG